MAHNGLLLRHILCVTVGRCGGHLPRSSPRPLLLGCPVPLGSVPGGEIKPLGVWPGVHGAWSVGLVASASFQPVIYNIIVVIVGLSGSYHNLGNFWI